MDWIASLPTEDGPYLKFLLAAITITWLMIISLVRFMYSREIARLEKRLDEYTAKDKLTDETISNMEKAKADKHEVEKMVDRIIMSIDSFRQEINTKLDSTNYRIDKLYELEGHKKLGK